MFNFPPLVSKLISLPAKLDIRLDLICKLSVCKIGAVITGLRPVAVTIMSPLSLAI